MTSENLIVTIVCTVAQRVTERRGLSLCLGPMHVGARHEAQGERGGVDGWWREAAPTHKCGKRWGPAHRRQLIALARVDGAERTIIPLVLVRVSQENRIADSGSRRARIPGFEISELQKHIVFFTI